MIAVGPGGRDEAGKLIPIDLKVGDRVLFGKWSGTEVKIDGQELLIMKESDIMGVHRRAGGQEEGRVTPTSFNRCQSQLAASDVRIATTAARAAISINSLATSALPSPLL